MFGFITLNILVFLNILSKQGALDTMWTPNLITDGTLSLSILCTSFLSIPSFLSCVLALLDPIISDRDPQWWRGWLCPEDGVNISLISMEMLLTVSKHMCSEPINGSQEGSWKFLDNSLPDLQILSKNTFLSFGRKPTVKLELWAAGLSPVLPSSTLICQWGGFVF